MVSDDTLKCECLRKASQEIRELQMKDVELILYFQYLEERKVPTDEGAAKRLVNECEKSESLKEFCITKMQLTRPDAVATDRAYGGPC